MSSRWEDVVPNLSNCTLRAIESLKFARMTPVQASCIPLFLKNKDVAAEAVTGSGKTLAFLIPMLEIMGRREEKWRKYEVGGIIISPTRELARQTDGVLAHFLKFSDLHLRSFLAVGGESVRSDVLRFKEGGANIIVATPGRLEDLLGCGEVCLPAAVKSLEVLVLDEADQLLDLGFEKTLNTILGYLPRQRRTGLFSATQTDQVESLIRAGMRNPVVVAVKEKKASKDKAVEEELRTPVTLSSYYQLVAADRKPDFLISFIHRQVSLGHSKFILFLSTCACVEYFTLVLKELFRRNPVTADGVAITLPLFSIHGKMKGQQVRKAILDRFRASERGLLLCTDLMARGVDIPNVHWVLQYDPPNTAAHFIHRCGRTARIGNEGSALLLLQPSEEPYLEFIRRNQKTTMAKYSDSVESTPSEGHDGKFLKVAHQLQLADRAAFEKANRAFVSYIQAYSKHECNVILRTKDLDFGLLAQGFGLLRLPKMPELKGKSFDNFIPVNVDPTKIPYKDSQREMARKEKLKTYEETGSWPGNKKKKNSSKPWSKSKEAKAETKARKNRKRKRGKTVEEEEDREKEIDELLKDAALVRKLKRGKITDDDFNSLFGLDDKEEAADESVG